MRRHYTPDGDSGQPLAGFGGARLVKYLDGNTKTPTGEVTHPGYPEDWYRRVAAEQGGRLQVKPLPGEEPEGH